MSWKPCRSSGVMIDKHLEAEKKAVSKIAAYTEKEVLRLEDIYPMSRAVYSAVSNYNKARMYLGGKTDMRVMGCHLPEYHRRIFLRNPDKVYKPLLKLIQ